MFRKHGRYVEVIEERNWLKVKLESEGREYLQDRKAGGGGWEGHPDSLFQDLFDDIIANSSLGFLRADEIGALTSAPIIGIDVERDDDLELLETGNVYWHERYAVELAIEVLLERGEIDLPGAPENKY